MIVLMEIWVWLGKEWTAALNCIRRDCNAIANYLTRLEASSLPLNVLIIERPQIELQNFIFKDSTFVFH